MNKPKNSPKKSFKILLTGGGTAGHVLPHQPVVEALQKQIKHLSILYVGSKMGLEQKMVQNWGWPHKTIPVGKWRRYADWHNITDIFKVGAGILKSLWIIGQFRPQVIFSKGGYVSLPVMVAGWLFRVPLVIHDSDALPGMTTRLLARFAQRICLGYGEAASSFPAQKTVVTGIPIRASLFTGSRQKGLKLAGFDAKKPLVLVMGGSLGAKRINEAVWGALPELLNVCQVVHITGKGKTAQFSEFRDKNAAPKKRKGYRSFEYVEAELPDLYAAASLIVTRAGANSLAEIQALLKPSLVVPLGQEASHGDQLKNAQILEKRGGCVVVPDEKLTSKRLIAGIKLLFASPKQLETMGKRAFNPLHKEAGERVTKAIIDFL